MSCKICQVKTQKEICDLCEKCIQIDKNKPCNHEFNKTCEKCRQYNKLKHSISCDYCGSSRQENHSLCIDCIKNTKICICGQRMDKNFKYCYKCSNMTQICIFKNCANLKTNNNFCKNHSCDNCDNFSFSEYCDNCGCNRRFCDNLRHENLKNCIDHLCQMSFCNKETFKGIYCAKHICSFKDCNQNIIKNFKYCRKHKCSLCKNVVKDEGDTYNNYRLCVRHNCRYPGCKNEKYKDTKYCIKCVSKLKNCSYYKDKNMNVDKNCPNKCVKNYNLDYIKVHDYFKENNKPFWKFFKNCFYILLWSLKKKNIFIPKDIKKIIFYTYLERKIIHCFLQKCFICDNSYLETKELFE